MKTALLLLLSFVCVASAGGRAAVAVVPNRSQYVEYEQFTVSCHPSGSDTWTVWRYTMRSLQMSRCGSSWGTPVSSACHVTVKPLSSGVYWCESNDRTSSNVVNITVTDKPVILLSPVLPLTAGDNVTLHCRAKSTTSDLLATFYKDGSPIRTEAAGHMTIHHISKSDEGSYTCRVGDLGESPPSWITVSGDGDAASLSVSPDSSQLGEYENLSLNCGDNSSVRGWRVMRFTTSSGALTSCGDDWGTPTVSGCFLKTTKQSDSATYWCESPSRQRSNSVKLDVYDKPVILLSPVLPVTAGDNVTLHCRAKSTTSDPLATFYKDGSPIRTEAAGHMTIHHISKSDEGSYTCRVGDLGESPPSWLFVRGQHRASDSIQSVLTMCRCIVVCSPYIVSTVLLTSRYRHMDNSRTTGPQHEDRSMTTSPPDEDNDNNADVTTEHQF